MYSPLDHCSLGFGPVLDLSGVFNPTRRQLPLTEN